MIAVLLTIHILVIAALIVVVLLQRSEGGALFSGGGFMTGRGAANALTRTTSILASIFFLTSLSLAYIASHSPKEDSLIEQIRNDGAPPAKKGEEQGTDLLRSLGAPKPATETPAAPATTAPAQPAPSDADLLETPPPATETPATAPAEQPAAETPAPAEPQNQPQ
jgi:preprotein translocase subunit SecG